MVEIELYASIALVLTGLGLFFFGIGKGFENWGKKPNCCCCEKKKE